MSASQPLLSEQQHQPSPQSQPNIHPRLPPIDLSVFALEDLANLDVNGLAEDFKSLLIREVFTKTAVPPPEGFAQALADRVTFGRYKYHDVDTRELRDHFNGVIFADADDIQPLPLLRNDDTQIERFRRALVEAITMYFDIVKTCVPLTAEVQEAVEMSESRFCRRGFASSYLNDLVRFVFHRAEGDQLHKVCTAAKLVTGFGVQFDCSMYPWCAIGTNQADFDVDQMYWKILLSLVANTLSCDVKRVYSSSGSRWKFAIGGKLTMSIVQASRKSLIEIASRMVDIDYCHNIIEGGLAVAHSLGWHAVVGPNMACTLFLEAIGEYKVDRKDLMFKRVESSFNWLLVDDDKNLQVEILGRKVPEENMISLQGGVFSSAALANFIDWDVAIRQSVLVSEKGVILYFPTHVGPWKSSLSPNANVNESLNLVISINEEEREAQGFDSKVSEMQKRLEKDWLPQAPVPEHTKRRFQYIKNKPGRALVRRRGLSGSYGIIIISLLLACGVVTAVVNWAERDNWLERAFDGAQVASLLAAFLIVVIFFLTGTLTNTLDLLAGVTEAADIDQLALLTGMSIVDLQVVLTYARGTLYWLSEHNTSYCRAVRLGELVMTKVLSVSRHVATRDSIVIGKREADGSRRAVWVMQARYNRLEQSEGAGGLWHIAEELKFEEVKVGGCTDGAVTDME